MKGVEQPQGAGLACCSRVNVTDFQFALPRLQRFRRIAGHLLGSYRTKFFMFMDTWAQYQLKKTSFHSISTRTQFSCVVRSSFAGFIDAISLLQDHARFSL